MFTQNTFNLFGEIFSKGHSQKALAPVLVSLFPGFVCSDIFESGCFATETLG